MQPAVMVSFSPAENIRALRKRLGTIAPSLEDIEMEELVLLITAMPVAVICFRAGLKVLS